MDLAVEAERLRLDVLAVQLSGALTAAGVPHALLKGPTTSLWLYDVPRAYRDVDLLVPRSRVDHAVAALGRAGLAHPAGGRLGEEAPHSLLLHSAEGFEVDLHVALPAMTAAGDLVWDVLAPGVVAVDLGIGTVPALGPAGRCLVLALHALNGHAHDQAHTDLLLARERVEPDTWRDAADLARRLDVHDLFAAGLGTVDPGAPAPALSRRAHLRLTDAPAAAIGLDRVWAAPVRERPRLLRHELVPSRGFMHHAHPESTAGPTRLVAAHVRRWRRLARQLPDAVRALRRYRHPG